MNATFGGYSARNYMTRPGDTTAQIGQTIAGAVRDLPGAFQQQAAWDREASQRDANEQQKRQLYDAYVGYLKKRYPDLDVSDIPEPPPNVSFDDYMNKYLDPWSKRKFPDPMSERLMADDAQNYISEQQAQGQAQIQAGQSKQPISVFDISPEEQPGNPSASNRMDVSSLFGAASRKKRAAEMDSEWTAYTDRMMKERDGHVSKYPQSNSPTPSRVPLPVSGREPAPQRPEQHQLTNVSLPNAVAMTGGGYNATSFADFSDTPRHVSPGDFRRDEPVSIGNPQPSDVPRIDLPQPGADIDSDLFSKYRGQRDYTKRHAYAVPSPPSTNGDPVGDSNPWNIDTTRDDMDSGRWFDPNQPAQPPSPAMDGPQMQPAPRLSVEPPTGGASPQPAGPSPAPTTAAGSVPTLGVTTPGGHTTRPAHLSEAREETVRTIKSAMAANESEIARLLREDENDPATVTGYSTPKQKERRTEIRVLRKENIGYQMQLDKYGEQEYINEEKTDPLLGLRAKALQAKIDKDNRWRPSQPKAPKAKDPKDYMAVWNATTAAEQRVANDAARLEIFNTKSQESLSDPEKEERKRLLQEYSSDGTIGTALASAREKRTAAGKNVVTVASEMASVNPDQYQRTYRSLIMPRARKAVQEGVYDVLKQSKVTAGTPAWRNEGQRRLNYVFSINPFPDDIKAELQEEFDRKALGNTAPAQQGGAITRGPSVSQAARSFGVLDNPRKALEAASNAARKTYANNTEKGAAIEAAGRANGVSEDHIDDFVTYYLTRR